AGRVRVDGTFHEGRDVGNADIMANLLRRAAGTSGRDGARYRERGVLQTQAVFRAYRASQRFTSGTATGAVTQPAAHPVSLTRGRAAIRGIARGDSAHVAAGHTF